MLQMMWEWVSDSSLPSGGTAYARKPRGRDGQPRLPDGETWLSLEQVMAKTGRTREWMIKEYCTAMKDLVPSDELDAFIVDQVPVAESRTSEGELPAATLSADDPSTHVSPDRLAMEDLVRVTRYPEFDDVEWNMAKSLARSKGLSIVWSQIYFFRELEPATRKHKIVPLLSIDAIRKLARRSPQYGGEDLPAYQYDENNRLVSATMTVYVMVGEPQVARPVSAIVYAQEFAGIGLADYEERMPHHRLGKIVEAQVKRKAFPEEIGKCYLPEEMGLGGIPSPTDPRPVRPPGKAKLSGDNWPEAFDPPSDDGMPVLQAHGHDRKPDPLKEAHRRLATAGRR